MDIEEIFGLIFVSLLLVCILCFSISIVMDNSSYRNCKILGYDNGEQQFFQARTVCWNIVESSKEEVREYFILEK